jgi:hypothetical protein
MIMSDQVKTAEQAEQEQIINAEQSKESARFMRRNPLFKATPSNAKKMGDYIKGGGLSWTADSLEQIFNGEHNAEFEKNEPYVAPEPVAPKVVEEKLPRWGKLETRSDVHRIPRALYREFMTDPAFQRAVEAVGGKQ